MIGVTLPVFCNGTVIKGFGRGSKQLGIPTANYSNDVVENLPLDLPTGVYYGWAQVNNGQVHKMVMSIGWNPFYQNKTKSMETHIMHQFDGDFYGSNLKTCILAYIRPELDFSSLNDLIAQIKADIDEADEQLVKPEKLQYKTDPFFTSNKTVAKTSNKITPSTQNGDINRTNE